MMDRPAFPGSLPPKPTLTTQPRPAVSTNSSAADSSGLTKIILVFLAVLTLSNLALTFYFNQPKDTAPDTAASTKLQSQQQELAELIKEIAGLKAKLAVNMNEINRLKSDQLSLTARVTGLPQSRPLPYESMKGDADTAPRNAVEKPK